MTNSKFQFRRLKEDNIHDASRLVWEVFSEFEAPSYSPEGVLTFKEFVATDNLIVSNKNETIIFWGCFDEEELVGIIALREINHICLLFVKKVYHRRGIAKALFELLKNHCIKISSQDKFITVNSSPYAVNIYEHLGFAATDKELLQNGLRFIPMRYIIN